MSSLEATRVMSGVEGCARARVRVKTMLKKLMSCVEERKEVSPGPVAVGHIKGWRREASVF